MNMAVPPYYGAPAPFVPQPWIPNMNRSAPPQYIPYGMWEQSNDTGFTRNFDMKDHRGPRYQRNHQKSGYNRPSRGRYGSPLLERLPLTHFNC